MDKVVDNMGFTTCHARNGVVEATASWICVKCVAGGHLGQICRPMAPQILFLVRPLLMDKVVNIMIFTRCHASTVVHMPISHTNWITQANVCVPVQGVYMNSSAKGVPLTEMLIQPVVPCIPE